MNGLMNANRPHKERLYTHIERMSQNIFSDPLLYRSSKITEATWNKDTEATWNS